jgi:putative flippase GtrA
VSVLRHSVNLGKGGALRTAFNHVLLNEPGAIGVVTADADGQHRPDDIVRVAEALNGHPQELILGARRFKSDVPARSRFGNQLTRFIFKLLLGQSLRDTQTGLRAIPTSFLPALMRLKGPGYEFELEMLVEASSRRVPVREVDIATIYSDGNSSSHFNPLVDSIKIYFVFFRFLGSSMLTQLIDTVIFSLAFWISGHVLASQFVGRFTAGAINFAVNKRFVFKSGQQPRREIARYFSLVLFMMVLSYALIQAQVRSFGTNIVLAKIIAEGALFFLSFSAQRLYVFSSKPNA